MYICGCCVKLPLFSFFSFFGKLNHSVKFLQVSDSDEEDEENSGDEPSPRALRRLRQSQSSSSEKGRVTRSTPAEPPAVSPARRKRFTRSSAPGPTRSDEQGKCLYLVFGILVRAYCRNILDIFLSVLRICCGTLILVGIVHGQNICIAKLNNMLCYFVTFSIPKRTFREASQILSCCQQ